MKVSLIFPKHSTRRKYFDMEKGSFCSPLNLITLAGCTPPEFDVQVIDENVDKINYSDKVDLVGITGSSWQAKRAYEIAGEYRKQGIPVVMGGIHASMLPEEARQYVDSVVIGEADELWPEILRDFSKGNLSPAYQVKERPDLKKLAIPRWDLLKIGKYAALTIQTTRGCPYSCEFCTVQKFNGNKYRRKPIENIIAEFQYLKKFLDNRLVFVVDDNITADRQFAKELFKAMKPFKIKWFCQSPAKIADDDEVLSLMKDAGCAYIGVGFESISRENIEIINKSKVNKVEEYERHIERIHKAGIAVFGLFMIGIDFDSEESIMELPRFIEKNNIVFSHIPFITPFPGTELFDRLKKEGRLIDDRFWLSEKLNAPMEPLMRNVRNISGKRLKALQLQIIQRLNSLDVLYDRLRKAWSRGVMTNQGPLSFLKTKFFLSLLLVMNLKDPAKRAFILRCALSRHNLRVTSILLALNSYSHAFGRT